MHRTLLACFAAFAFAFACPTAAQAADTTQVGVENGELIYTGDLDREANRRLFALYDRLTAKPSVLRIRSEGGEVGTGLDLADWVRANRLDVKVTEHCLSSCANYVFPAGARKIVSHVAVIGFHGGLSSTSFRIELDDEMQAAHDAMTKEEQAAYWDMVKREGQPLLEREQAFFRTIGVRQDITTYGQAARFRKALDGAVGWTYTQDGFRRFGVDGIEVIGGPWQPAMRDADLIFGTLDGQ